MLQSAKKIEDKKEKGQEQDMMNETQTVKPKEYLVSCVFLTPSLFNNHASVEVSIALYQQQTFIAANINKQSVCTVAQYIWSHC